jgi:hypothetical protein
VKGRDEDIKKYEDTLPQDAEDNGGIIDEGGVEDED